jgi:tetratricopeptide (TPR) repeat protein
LLARPDGLSGLVADLLRPEGGPPIDPGAEVGTRSLAAWRSYEEARRALGTWRVQAAMAALRRTIEADPAFAPAHLWLAQLLVWRSAPASEWAAHAAVTTRGRSMLSVRDRRVADAMQALAQDRYREACMAYDALRHADSLDAVAWLGLAYCEGLNPHIVRDTRSASGWSFEGGIHSAQQAYARAVRIAPAAFDAFSFDIVIGKLFTVEAGRLRRGTSPDSTIFSASPDLVADTIAFVPYPFAHFGRLTGRVLAPHYDRALSNTRDRLLLLLATLAQSLPNDPDVFEALALVLEVRDEIAGTPNGGYSALSALERAKILATDSTQRTRLGASDVRLHLKLGDFSRAVSLGDSVLAAMPRAAGQQAASLAGIAALLGREREAVRLVIASGVSLSSGTVPEAPPVAKVSAALFMRTALGVCDDSVRTLPRVLVSTLESYEPPGQVARMRDDLLERPLVMAADCLGPGATRVIDTPSGLMPHLLEMLARGDTARARTTLDSLQSARPAIRPGDVSLDRTLSESWLRAAWRDTTAAIRQLDLTLTALPTLRTQMAVEPAMSAALGRSMAYRAELAARTGDRGTAALWAGRVLTLWTHADASLAPTMARMKQLVTQSR